MRKRGVQLDRSSAVDRHFPQGGPWLGTSRRLHGGIDHPAAVRRTSGERLAARLYQKRRIGPIALHSPYAGFSTTCGGKYDEAPFRANCGIVTVPLERQVLRCAPVRIRLPNLSRAEEVLVNELAVGRPVNCKVPVVTAQNLPGVAGPGPRGNPQAGNNLVRNGYQRASVRLTPPCGSRAFVRLRARPSRLERCHTWNCSPSSSRAVKNKPCRVQAG